MAQEIEVGDELWNTAENYTSEVVEITETAIITADGTETAKSSVKIRIESDNYNVELLKA